MPKILKGVIVSTKMQKTVVVKVERVYMHPLYKKIVRRNKRYKARNEKDNLAVGDVVTISETRPLAKDVHFKVSGKIS